MGDTKRKGGENNGVADLPSLAGRCIAYIRTYIELAGVGWYPHSIALSGGLISVTRQALTKSLRETIFTLVTMCAKARRELQRVVVTMGRAL